MTSHDALKLKPKTLVRWIPPKGSDSQAMLGSATMIPPTLVVVVWEDIAEPNTRLNVSDRLMLAAVEILEPIRDDQL